MWLKGGGRGSLELLVRDFVNETFPGRCGGLVGSGHPWPPRFPNVTLLNYSCKYTKKTVFAQFGYTDAAQVINNILPKSGT